MGWKLVWSSVRARREQPSLLGQERYSGETLQRSGRCVPGRVRCTNKCTEEVCNHGMCLRTQEAERPEQHSPQLHCTEGAYMEIHTLVSIACPQSEVMGREPRCYPVVWAKGVSDLAFVLTCKARFQSLRDGSRGGRRGYPADL